MSIGSERFPVQFAYKDDLIDDLELNSTTLYVTIYEIEYNNIRRTLASTVYHTKEEAADEINSDNREFKFSMNEKTSRYNKESFKNQEYVARSLKGKSNIASAYLSELKQTPKRGFPRNIFTNWFFTSIFVYNFISNKNIIGIRKYSW